MTVKATLCTGRDLKPGDLFSIRDQEYWSRIDERESVGESVYVRTNIPAGTFPDADEEVYKIEVER